MMMTSAAPRRLAAAVSRRVSVRRLSAPASPLVRVESDAAHPTLKIVTLQSDPAKLNPMTVALGEAFREQVGALSQLPPSELRCVLLTGEGRAFSAGGDLDFLEQRKHTSPTSNAIIMRSFYARFLGALRALPVPVVCHINGPAIGAGCAVTMGADLRVTHDACKLGFNFVKLGLHPGMGCTHTIRAAAGGQLANRLLLTGDLVTGAEAATLGLVSASMPDVDAARAEALRLARGITEQSPNAVRATLRTLRARSDVGLEEALQREADAQAQSYASADYAEGLASIREKRTPAFPGDL